MGGPLVPDERCEDTGLVQAIGYIAFYYLRVLEIPTPRWPTYDAKFYVAKLYSLASMPEVPVTTQERAYSSPIWYSP